MITEQDLNEAILECESERNPNANTCIKLAAFYTIRNNMYPSDGYSFSDAPKVNYNSESDFGQIVDGMEWNSVLEIMDELMDTIHVMMPRLYDGVMRKLREV